MAAQAELERASTLLVQQKFTECAALCGAIVAREPRNALATHLLGLAIKETGDWAQGEQWLRQSIQLEPQRAEFHANLANLLRRRQKFRQAEKFYRQALQLAPTHQPSRRSLVLTLQDLGRFTEGAADERAGFFVAPVDEHRHFCTHEGVAGGARDGLLHVLAFAQPLPHDVLRHRVGERCRGGAVLTREREEPGPVELRALEEREERIVVQFVLAGKADDE